MTHTMKIMMTHILTNDFKYCITGGRILGRENDYDIICSKETAYNYIQSEYLEIIKEDNYCISCKNGDVKIEFLLTDYQESLKIFLERSINHKILKEDLLRMKLGHIHRPHKKWFEHMNDIIELKKEFPYINRNDNLVQLHIKCTDERIGIQKLPKLNKSKSEFFDDKVIKYIDHDIIHEIVAQNNKPAYTFIQEEGSEVQCSKTLWNQVSNEIKLNCVYEETLVITIERHILPTIKGDKIRLQPLEAYKWALMRICTDLTSGWFRDFAIDNYEIILDRYDENKIYKYLELILKQIK